jgi:hypothetical protein
MSQLCESSVLSSSLEIERAGAVTLEWSSRRRTVSAILKTDGRQRLVRPRVDDVETRWAQHILECLAREIM